MEYQGVFERYEKKYLLTEETYRQVAKQLRGHMQPDRYGPSTICNVYFDTPDYRIIRRSLEKPVYKEKLRLRSYGVPQAGSCVYVELKKKYKGVVYKRRTGMTLRQAEDYLYRGGALPCPSQIGREIDWFLSFYRQVLPAMYLSYRRAAFCGREDSGLRVTFDADITWRQTALFLGRGSWGNLLLPVGTRLMEIKAPSAMPVWLARVLDAARVYPVSFSKYGAAYEQAMQLDTGLEKKGETISA